MDILILRFDAPLMSFGGVMVDRHGPTDRFPGQSLLAGLCGNALGLTHADADALTALQDRIEYAARWDRDPVLLIDYHTVDLSQEKMCQPGWTTRGVPEHRAGSRAAAFGTHERRRHYWANGLMTVALTLLGDGEPDVCRLEGALRRPARPLFLGRKTCLPATPLLMERVTAADVMEALRRVPPANRNDGSPQKVAFEACWPAKLGSHGSGRQVAVYDRRDWRNQVHAGRHLRMEGLLVLEVQS